MTEVGLGFKIFSAEIGLIEVNAFDIDKISESRPVASEVKPVFVSIVNNLVLLILLMLILHFIKKM